MTIEKIEIKDEYTYKEIKEMVAMVVGWFTAKQENGFTFQDIEKYREYTAICCEELASLVSGGCMPYDWEEDFEDDDTLRH